MLDGGWSHQSGNLLQAVDGMYNISDTEYQLYDINTKMELVKTPNCTCSCIKQRPNMHVHSQIMPCNGNGKPHPTKMFMREKDGKVQQDP